MAACDNVETSLSLVQNLLCMVEQFTAVATADPLSGLLVAVGGLLTTASVAVLGYLAAGAALDWFVP